MSPWRAAAILLAEFGALISGALGMVSVRIAFHDAPAQQWAFGLSWGVVALMALWASITRRER